VPDTPFELICEIEPPTRPSLTHARHQIGVLSKVADAFLIPDNHLGRATVSSVAVAHEVAAMGGRAIACLNSRDRNVLGFRRDLLTAAAYGVDEFLLVYGDRPESGQRSDDVSVRRMLDEIRTFGTSALFEGRRPFRVGATSRLAPLPSFKSDVDFVFAQVSYSVDELLRWREQLRFDGGVYAGVLVVASPGMARKLSADNQQLAIPPHVLARVERDLGAGIDLACELVDAVRATGAFDGVHLVPVGRYREVALRLERDGWRRRPPPADTRTGPS
jgi:methylenetetrahydrofolate reductase (NADPH)